MKITATLIGAALMSMGMAHRGIAAESMQPDSVKMGASELTIRGDVQLIEGEFYFVKDMTGHQVRLHVNSETRLEGRIKVGDKIDAIVTSEGHALSIREHLPEYGAVPHVPDASSKPVR